MKRGKGSAKRPAARRRKRPLNPLAKLEARTEARKEARRKARKAAAKSKARKSAKRTYDRKRRAVAAGKAVAQQAATMKAKALRAPPKLDDVTSRARTRAPAKVVRKPTASFNIELANNYREAWDTAAGRAVMADLLVFAGVGTLIDARDPVALAMQAGERNVGLRIVQMLGLHDADIPAATWTASDHINGMQEERTLYAN